MKNILKSILMASVLAIVSSQAWAWGCQDYGYTVYEPNGRWMSTMDPVKAVDYMASFPGRGAVFINDEYDGCKEFTFRGLQGYTGIYVRRQVHRSAPRVTGGYYSPPPRRTGHYHAPRRYYHDYNRQRRRDDRRRLIGSMLIIGGALILSDR